MFGIGPMEFLLIAVVAVVVIGPEKLPDMLKKFGRFYVQAKRHANDVKSGFDSAIHEAERELELDRIRELQKQIQAATLADVIDAKHTDHSTPQVQGSDASPDGIHTDDGRLLSSVQSGDAAQDASGSSAMPPDELKAHEDETKTSYHEGHLPAHLPKDDHDPFAASSLQNPSLASDDQHTVSSTSPGISSSPGTTTAPGTSTSPGLDPAATEKKI